MGDPEKHDARNNLWESAPPYHVFLNHGYEVDFVSPKGGPVEFSMNPIGISRYAIKYERFNEKTQKTLKPDEVDPQKYDAVYFGGGAGPLFDVAHDKNTQKIVSEIYENGGLIGGCGHGPGGFANITLSNGTYLVKGKRIAAFPDSTERTKPWAKQGTLLPFLVESQLKKNGAIALNKTHLADKYEVIIDKRIVTTMFLPSAAIVAKEMIIEMEKN
ncbi:MAG: type 1 glutamine amidotransferase domain-containing protein [Pseudobacteriovorax sp.]|nr:type 1 glutamine amidotransferase domain-containing protein [Pseudobacteriovorax sp.]